MKVAVSKDVEKGSRSMSVFFPGSRWDEIFPSIGEALDFLQKQREEKKESEEAKGVEAEESKEKVQEEDLEPREILIPRSKRANKEVQIPEGFEDVLYILPGMYEEQVSITLSNLLILGAGMDQTRIYGELGGHEILEDGIKRGTFRTQTVFVHGKNIAIRNLTIENGAGQGHEVGQAIALYADGDQLLFDNLQILGHQDTLFCGPLPEKEIEPGGFRGPLEHAPRINGRQFYYHCLISGTVDFIFGSGTAYFEDCLIYSMNPGVEDGDALGYITAPSTPEDQPFGFIFDHCTIDGECPPHSVYLGRPWRDYGESVFVECLLKDHIKYEGWDDWKKEKAREGCRFIEAGCYGPGSNSSHRAPFSKQVSLWEAFSHFEKSLVLEGWMPVGRR